MAPSVLPDGFKAQLVATSRLAAVRYQKALAEAQEELLASLESLDDRPPDGEPEVGEAAFLRRAQPHLDTIRRLRFAAVISGDHNDPPGWAEWTSEGKREDHISRFKKPLIHDDTTKADTLAFLCVKSMLLTGFDAPFEQVLYLDRKMQGHELLQAIARVNRTAPGKTYGLVVDYYGVVRHLQEALEAYSDPDVEGALTDLSRELPRLDDRHRRVLAVFADRGLDISETEACVNLLRDVEVRADFVVKLREFLESLDIVLPRPEALPYVSDAKTLGFINKAAANLYRDGQLALLGAGHKVRELIDSHLEARGVDPKVPPVSIMDAEFGQVVESHRSDRAKASEMEHAARHYISHRLHEDPAYYRKLSERLEGILARLEGNWPELVEELRRFTEEVRRGRPADDTGLDPRTQAPFLSLLIERQGEQGAPSPERLRHLAPLTVELVDFLRSRICVVDFWRNSYRQNALRGEVIQFLDDNDLSHYDKQPAVADEIVELARSLHARLCP